MKLIINIIIIMLIIAFALYLLIKTFQRGKQGKCAACDYDCELKKQLAKNKK
ncbi:FeoB-associated Cys-rich membrane protein [Limosilactobacillus sp. RRLNB_1_1]|uniref:FeoB-associated Cys-rich membrane protein n=1 Tax=Limosilactobacillus albertensis TaxID=2759752 RepID=A0A7W3Y8A0_9LACO|nr:FeoB-associated Cys-rich membrane protein [Limosilactobacillus albertensis]MBC8744794.1 FeoB-associated Cys-rich membrane protein [Lactobacillus sp. Marseille-P7033]NGC77209.1 FeoB-associated Cys-rich membrane protein [Limosilactobacillus reuteri]MBB1069790.1 FeoB-associated Cys-rich membrane protein [Limosilactobacillus albertensis]MBB1122980.1 FeoB-associated Cys-rich membrane protein [Limosilactobacillus albertensis]MCD7117668.1 FeoB-associated Cys-rich membrane protein [Limosilactobacil